MKGFLSRFCDKESNVPSKDIKDLTVAIKDLKSSIEKQSHKAPETPEEKSTKEPMETAPSIFWNILEKWKALLTFSTPIAIFIGAATIYNYLANIGSVALFSEMVSSPSLLLSIVIFFLFLIIFVFVFPFYAPYLLVDQLKILKGDRKDLLWSVVPTFALWVWFVFCSTITFDIKDPKDVDALNAVLLWIMFLASSVSSLYFLFKNKLLKGWHLLLIIFFWFLPLVWSFKPSWLTHIPEFNLIVFGVFGLIPLCSSLYSFWKKNEIFNLWIMNVCLSLSQLFLIMFSLFFVTSWFKDIYWPPLLFIGFFYLVNILIMCMHFHENEKVNDIAKYTPFVLLVFLAFFIPLLPGSNVSTTLLYKLGYIQKSDNAGWYAFDNRLIDWYKLQTNTSEEIYSFRNWKEKFQPTEAKEKARNLSKNPNTLYGYMAWNVGGTKIFCPKSVELPKETEAKDKRPAINKFSTQCLTIKGDYLQPLPTGL